jgi:hypothetical protein
MLNDTFALQLCKPDVTLSPRKYRERRRNDEEARVDDIYLKIQRLHYKGDNRLATCLGRFQQQGRMILSDSVSRSSGSRTSATNRTLLQQCLLDILRKVDDPESRQWSKRESEEIPEYSPKRARGQLYDHHDAVDALPVRSRDSFASINTVAASGSRTLGGAFQPPQHVSFDRSFLSSRTSFHSEVFSPKHTQTQDEPFLTQTTVDSESPNNSNNYTYSQRTAANSFSGISESSQNGNILKQMAIHPPRGQNGFTSNSQSQTLVTSSSHSRQDSNGFAKEVLEDKLANIWRGYT